ncbi:ABC transporter permease [Blautia argi]|uniref:ABC transporter permease n=2 Tax=Lachnospiraceae TaxID=186803 RepID=A0A2Z4UEG9_9FIRM|nr:ABC transporter permease [Blautia argi]
MMKKNSLMKTLTNRVFRQNKGRNFVAVFAILLTTLMFTTLFVLAQSISENMVVMNFRQSGYDAQASFKQITEEEVKKIKNHEEVKEVGESLVLGLAENEKLAGRQVEIRWADELYASHSFAAPVTGHMPEKENEVAVGVEVLDRLGIPHKLGEKVTLQWRKDLQSFEVTESTFTLCGFWDDNMSSYASYAWVSKEFAQEMIKGVENPKDQILGTRMAQVHLKSTKNIEDTMNRILGDTGLENLEYGVNLAYSPEMGVQAVQESLPMYASMLLVFVAGYLIIYNIFQISVSADIQFYGKLKTLGTTKKQIKKLIYGQANRLCLIGIPLGLLLGWLLGKKLVPALISWAEGTAVVSVNPLIFLGSAVFAWLTVMISCLRPARIAGKISPVEALRYCDAETRTKKKKKKRPQTVTVAQMAWANLWRNKKRTVTVLLSLTLALVLLSAFYAKNAAFDMNIYLEELAIADFQFDDADSEERVNGYDPLESTVDEALLEKLRKLPGKTGEGRAYSREISMTLSDNAVKNMKNYYTAEVLQEWASYDKAGAEGCEQAMETKEVRAEIWGIEGIPLESQTKESYLLNGTFDKDKFATGKYILAEGPGTEEKGVTMPTYSVGEKVEIQGETFEVMAVTAPLVSVTEGASEKGNKNGYSMKFLLPADVFSGLWPDSTVRKFYVNVDTEKVLEAEEQVQAYLRETGNSSNLTSKNTIAQQYEKETRSSAVMGNAISIIIAIVGILNFINSMVTSVVSRRKEFAMIQSVGMGKKQLRKMLVLEGLYYAGLTLTASYLFSSLVVGIVIRGMTQGGMTSFHFTLFPLVICTPLLVAFAVAVPYFCFRNLEKQSLVERLRNE